MQNENLNNENAAPVVEKISKKTLKAEKTQMSIENNALLNNLLNTINALSDEDLDKTLAFVNKKVDLIKKKTGK